MKLKLLALALTASLFTAPLPALAQTAHGQAAAYTGAVSVPPVIAQAHGARQVGFIGGLSAWTIPGQDALFIVAPDGKSTIIGYAFGADGSDIGAQLTGKPVLDLSEILKAQADIEAQTLLAPQAAGSELPTAAEGTPSSAATGIGGIDPKLDELAAQIDASQSPEEFKAALQQWVADLEAQNAALSLPSGSPAPSTEVVEAEIGISAPLPPPVTTMPATGPLSAGPAVTAQGVEAAPSELPASPAQVASAPMTATELLAKVRDESFWFEVGQFDAPTVYAFIDPDCPFCARSMLTLQDQVESGKLKLRVMLTPFLSAKSVAYAGAVLTSQDPELPAPVAFWKHELEKAYGTSTLAPLADLSTIPNALVDGMQANIDLMKAARISGVPFFVWNSAEGPQTHFGVPQADQFVAALPETDQPQQAAIAQ
jgi:protein-disulfide isomerase